MLGFRVSFARQEISNCINVVHILKTEVTCLDGERRLY